MPFVLSRFQAASSVVLPAQPDHAGIDATNRRYRRQQLCQRSCLGLALIVPMFCSMPVTGADELPAVSFEQGEHQLKILIDGRPFATYVFRDEKTPRPHFAHIKSPGGLQVTRNHPPQPNDVQDHRDLHPGIWLAFGDLGGADFWRNKARVQHVRFEDAPEGGPGRGSFTVVNRYLDGDRIVCEEFCRHKIRVRPSGWLLTYDSQFHSQEPFSFGDQEEMGLGVRVASPIRVRGGNGTIVNSDGHVNEPQVWGKAADWCDYSGTLENQRIGMMVIPHPKNFRPSWFHARDYGFVTANPFGRHALTGGDVSQVTIQPNDIFRLRFAVLVHSTPADQNIDLSAAYKDVLESTFDR